MKNYYYAPIVWILIHFSHFVTAQCKDGKDYITGHKITYAVYKLRGLKEYITISKTETEWLFSYHNSETNDKKYVVPINSAVRFVMKDKTIDRHTTIAHRAQEDLGISFWVPIERDDLVPMMYLKQIEISLPDETRIIKFRQSKLYYKMRPIINCMY